MLSKHNLIRRHDRCSVNSLITSVLICVVVGERNAQHLGELSGVVNYSSDHQDCLPHPHTLLHPWVWVSFPTSSKYQYHSTPWRDAMSGQNTRIGCTHSLCFWWRLHMEPGSDRLFPGSYSHLFSFSATFQGSVLCYWRDYSIHFSVSFHIPIV